jgi:hypothetical protein
MGWVIVALFAAACVSHPRVTFIELERLASAPEQYEGQRLRTCGFVSRQWEDANLRTQPISHFEDSSVPGLAFFSNGPFTQEPEWACLTGTVKPLGWQLGARPEDGYQVTDTGYSWEFVEE